ncbi:MAG: hypothetical protein J6K61_03585 [Clostridia bacterium]|nr:hypothetical protein [Clostridia bacterium]
MKNILLIGIGGTGAHTVELLQRKIKEYGKQTDNRIASLIFDTDAEQISSARGGLVLDATDSATVGTVCDRLGHGRLSTWFPVKNEDIREEDLHRGSAAWRKKALLCLHNMLNDRRSAEVFHNELERFAAFPFAKSYEIYFVASLAGGTGAGLLLPLAMYTKRFLNKFHFNSMPRFHAMLSCPDIYADSTDAENATRYFANAYAALRELNAINLVAYGYNGKTPSRRAKDKEQRKNDPAIFRLESPNPEEISGVLFDASEEKYQKTSSVPFRSVYLLDRIAGVRTVKEHEEALADSLYTLTCTKAEGMFDHLSANADTQRSLQHGAGAVFAALSAAKLSFPREHILRALAQKKTSALQEEWLSFLKEATEADGGKNDFYHLYIQAFREAASNSNSPLAFLRDEWQLNAPQKNPSHKKHETVTEKYLKGVKDAARRALPSYRETVEEITGKLPDTPPSFSMRTKAKYVFLSVYKKLRTALAFYEEECRDEIPFAQKSLSGIAFGFGLSPESKSTPLTSLLLCDEDGKALHPLAAPLRIACLKDALHRALKGENDIPSSDTEKEEDTLWSMMYGDSLPSRSSKKERKSAYARLTSGKNRIEAFASVAEAYLKKRTDVMADAELLLADFEAAFTDVLDKAVESLCHCVYRTTEAKIDTLLSSYRRLFTEWSDAAHRYQTAAEDASRKNGARNRNTHTILASFEEKEALFDEISRSSTFENPRAKLLRDQKAGEAILTFALQDAEATYYDQPHPNKASVFFHHLFEEMENAHFKMLENSGSVSERLPGNIVKALEEATRTENGIPLSEDEQKAAMRVRLSELFHAANPPLRLNMTLSEDVAWKPGEASVVMLSEETADYIASRATFYGIDLPDDAEKEELCRLAADRFVKAYVSPLPNVAVAPISDDLLYVANGKTNIEPVRIRNLDETSENPVYYNGYKELLRRMQARENDHYNPHLHFLSHARALLPFINPEAAKQENSRVLTALLYAVLSGEIALKEGKGYSYRDENGKLAPMTDESGAVITEEKLYLLIPWMRAHTAVTERLLSAWESTVAEERQLSASVSPTQFSKEISKNRLMRLLRDGSKAKAPYGILEFASAVKRSEEIGGSDYDAAEALLAVGFDMFLYGFALRRNPQDSTDAEAERYMAAINAFWSPFSDSERTAFPPSMLVNWVCRSSDVFCDIDRTKAGYRYKPYAFEA